jgi:hypothetical protein
MLSHNRVVPLTCLLHLKYRAEHQWPRAALTVHAWSVPVFFHSSSPRLCCRGITLKDRIVMHAVPYISITYQHHQRCTLVKQKYFVQHNARWCWAGPSLVKRTAMH